MILFKVCTANEVALVNTVNGANLTALAAGYTLLVVDNSKVVNDVNCIGRTVLLALSARNTAVKTELTNYSALIVVRALNDNRVRILNKVNYSVGTGAYAKSAANALSLVNDSNTSIRDFNSVLGTNRNTVAVSETSVDAGTVALVKEVCRTAASRSVVIVLSVLVVANAVAGYMSNQLYYVLCLNAEDCGNILCRSVTAGGTEVSLFTSSVRESRSISVTA